MGFEMHNLNRLGARQRRICNEALRRTDFPFDTSPVIVDVLAVNIYKKYQGRAAAGLFNPPYGPLEMAIQTLKAVEYSVHTFAHESGHAVSSIFLSDDQKNTIKEFFGASSDTPWLDPMAPPFERLEEAFAEAFASAYFDVVGKPNRYAYMATEEVQRDIRGLLTPDLPPEVPKELDGANLFKLVVKYRDRDGNQITDTLIRATTKRRLNFYKENDLPIKRALDRYERRNASIKIVAV